MTSKKDFWFNYNNETYQKIFKGVVAGGVTGRIKVLVVYPLDYVKTQLQLDRKGQNKKYQGTFDCIRKTIEERGIKGLYRGLGITLLTNVPKLCVRFGTYEIISAYLIGESGKLSGHYKLLCGLCAGTCEAILVTTPKETIKVSLIKDQRSQNPKLKGLILTVMQIIRTEGIFALYKGVTATVLKQGTNQAINFFTIGAMKDWYREKDPKRKPPLLLIGLFSCFAGSISVLCNNPIDVVKTRMQEFESRNYRNTFHCMGVIFKEEGFYALYKGTIPRLSEVCLKTGVSFMLHNTLMDLFNQLLQ